MAHMHARFIHTHSMRLVSGHEVLVTRVLAENGGTGVGFSLQLDATTSRHMALHHAGLRAERPEITPVLGHPWETAWVANRPIPWEVEPAFSRLQWLP
jgi:hypothetical protein